jgi:hypothetical protein
MLITLNKVIINQIRNNDKKYGISYQVKEKKDYYNFPALFFNKPLKPSIFYYLPPFRNETGLKETHIISKIYRMRNLSKKEIIFYFNN